MREVLVGWRLKVGSIEEKGHQLCLDLLVGNESKYTVKIAVTEECIWEVKIDLKNETRNKFRITEVKDGPFLP